METEEIVDTRHKPFPSINQYRNAIKLVRERAEYEHLPLPILGFVGTVKLHGTNAGVQWDENGTMLVQSRSNIIENAPKKDNYGFAAYVEANQETFDRMAKPNRVVYGEWCGGSIQGGVALSALSKMFVVFAVRDGEVWLSPDAVKDAVWSPLKSVFDFTHWFREVDFSRPEESQNMFADMTAEVERECPVGRDLGVSGVGEGIVWWPLPSDKFNVDGSAFKVKGEKHSETHVKVLAPVDLEKIENIRLLVDTIVTPARLQQKLAALIESGTEVDIRNTGAFLKLVATDVMKEEGDMIEASGQPLTSVMQRVSRVAKDFWMQQVK